ncbi:MAG: hypothetical protein R2860_10945 [Desulfobacterales bacterium]
MKSCRAVIAAVTMAGIVMGNFSTYARQELMEFKEGLTVMLIGMLFVLLAADVRISSILELTAPRFLWCWRLFLSYDPGGVCRHPFVKYGGGSGCLCPGLVPGDRRSRPCLRSR